MDCLTVSAGHKPWHSLAGGSSASGFLMMPHLRCWLRLRSHHFWSYFDMIQSIPFALLARAFVAFKMMADRDFCSLPRGIFMQQLTTWQWALLTSLFARWKLSSYVT